MRRSSVVLLVVGLVASLFVSAASSAFAGDSYDAAAGGVTNGKIAIVVNSYTDALKSCEDIWTMNPDGSNPVNLTASWVSSETWSSCERNPEWSPDGTQIAFSSARDGVAPAIWVMDADGSNAKRITTPPSKDEWDSAPTWSPDGEWIAFTRGYEVFGPMYAVHPDGTGLKLLPGDFSDLNATYPLDWAPDGSAIAYGASGADAAIETVAPDGTRTVVTTPGTVPRWSPDSSRIVYEETQSIRIVSRNGTGGFEFVADGSGPVWSPDGNTILYSQFEISTPSLSLFTMPLAGGSEVQIPLSFQTTGVVAYSEYDWQPILPPPPPADPFTDDDHSVFEADIEWMAAEGITKGCNPPTNDMFCPDSVVTRGQMAAFLVRALGLTDRLDDPFIDDDESIFEADIERLAAAGITKGCNPPTNDRFCPDSKVTREVMAAFLVRALGYSDPGAGDLFTDDNLSIFEADIDRLATAGVTKGCNPPTNDRFCPTGYVTRGQMAAFLHRALG